MAATSTSDRSGRDGQSARTFSFGSACFTISRRPAVSTRITADDTPPPSSVARADSPARISPAARR